MKLEDIGFYTLNDKRAKEVRFGSQLQRCELILTDLCNFKCHYCRGIKKELQGSLTFEQATEVVDIWASGGLKNIRFSGGEPTVWPRLLDLVKYTKEKKCIEHIALSTNGSAPIELYKKLAEAGVNDFSFSLDACCAKTADAMAGVNAKFEHLKTAIQTMSAITYCTVGIVLDEGNIAELQEIVDFATSLGVSDIRVIPSAQWNNKLDISVETKMPILSYRVNRVKAGGHVRGIGINDCTSCHLIKDDMVILSGKHFPCVIYMREQGNAIGDVYGKTLEEIMEERKAWFESHDSSKDSICSRNCLDFCIEHNNRVEELQ